MKKIVTFLIFIVFLFLAYGLIHQIWSAFQAEKRLSSEFEKLSGLQVKNQELKKMLSQAKSVDFLEQQARDKLGLSKEGETVFIIPQDKIDKVLGLSQKIEELRLPNWQGWLKLFFK